MYLVTKNKKYLDVFLFYFYFAPSTQIFLKISRKTFYKKKLAQLQHERRRHCQSYQLWC